MASAETQSWTADQVVKILERVPLFQGLTQEDLVEVAGLVKGRSLKKNELLFREGDPGDRFYIVFDGAIEILKERPKGDHERLAVKRKGDAFGEMALLTDAPRSASVRAVEPTHLLMVSKEDFQRLLGGDTLVVRIMRQLAKSLQALDMRLAATDSGSGGGMDALRQFSRIIQRGLLPRHAPEVSGYDIAGGVSQEQGGNGRSIWEWTRLASGAPALAVLDVKGGGVPPAYLLGMTRALLREIAGQEDRIDGALSRLNGALSENLFEGLDECVEVALVSFGDEGASLCVAGEQPGLVVERNGELRTLRSQGLALGIVPSFNYRTKPVEMKKGDVLVLLSEADAGLLRGISDLVLARRQESAGGLVELLQTALYKSETRDDISFIVAKRT